MNKYLKMKNYCPDQILHLIVDKDTNLQEK